MVFGGGLGLGGEGGGGGGGGVGRHTVERGRRLFFLLFLVVFIFCFFISFLLRRTHPERHPLYGRAQDHRQRPDGH